MGLKFSDNLYTINKSHGATAGNKFVFYPLNIWCKGVILIERTTEKSHILFECIYDSHFDFKPVEINLSILWLLS